MIEYINRRKQTYYLYEGKTKTGKPKYFFSRKKEGNSVDTIPDGYEIYENPNAQVFLRKIPVQVISLEEIETVKVGIKKHLKASDFIVDVKGKNIIVYLCDQNVDLSMKIMEGMFPNTPDFLRDRDSFAFSLSYSPMMQFVLDDVESRSFTVERWCFRGFIDGWIPLDSSTDLKKLVQTYGAHLGKESFYELM
jgi:hypothetical protein